MLFKVNSFKGILLLGSVTLPLTHLPAQNPLDETVSVLEQWVETERKLSQESAQWEIEKDSMVNLIDIYKQEIEILKEQIEEAESDTSVADKQRAELLAKQESIKEIEEAVMASIISAENEIKTLYPLLPPPLAEELRPLFNSLPKEPEKSNVAIGSRIQPIAAILTQIQKFDQVVTIVEGFQEFETGRTVQTETIYFGLGSAYYVDQANEHAGVGELTDSGWVWKKDDRLITPLRQFVDIYRGTKQAEYINLPVQIR